VQRFVSHTEYTCRSPWPNRSLSMKPPSMKLYGKLKNLTSLLTKCSIRVLANQTSLKRSRSWFR